MTKLSLTINQIATLLDIHRGVMTQHIIGTYTKDLLRLASLGLVTVTHNPNPRGKSFNSYELTELGSDTINKLRSAATFLVLYTQQVGRVKRNKLDDGFDNNSHS